MTAPSPFEAQFFYNPWKLFRNSTSEVIPSFAVMRIASVESFEGAIRFVVAKPNAATYDFYLVNGPDAVYPGKDGLCTTLMQSGYVAYNSGSGTPALNEVWGPKNGQWTIEKDYPGFWIAGGVKFTAGVLVVAAIQNCREQSLAIATLQYDLCGNTATIVDFARLDGTETVPAPTTADNTHFQHRGLAGDKVLLTWSTVDAAWLVINVTKHEYAVNIGSRRTGDCDLFCIEEDYILANLEICSTYVTRTVFCYPCVDSSVQTSMEQTSFVQTSNTQTSTIGCGDGVITEGLLDGTYGLAIQTGSPGSEVRQISVTITNQNGCGDDVGTYPDWIVLTPRTNATFQALTSPSGYWSVLTNNSGYLPGEPSEGQGYYESYFLDCRQRIDVITGETINPGDPTDVEWILEGGYGYPTLGLGNGGSSVRISETQGGAVDVLDGGAWTSMPGSLQILSLNPFHAIAIFTPPSWYPYSLQDTTCGPVKVEFLEIF